MPPPSVLTGYGDGWPLGVAAGLQLVGYKIKAILKDQASRCPEGGTSIVVLLSWSCAAVTAGPAVYPGLFSEHWTCSQWKKSWRHATWGRGHRSILKAVPAKLIPGPCSSWILSGFGSRLLTTGSAHCSSECLVKSANKQELSCCCEAVGLSTQLMAVLLASHY